MKSLFPKSSASASYQQVHLSAVKKETKSETQLSHLSKKWKIRVGRSVNCLGSPCGISLEQGSNRRIAFRCTPCIFALEMAYMQCLESMEKEHEQNIQCLFTSSAKIRDLFSDICMKDVQQDELRIMVHELQLHINTMSLENKQKTVERDDVLIRQKELEAAHAALMEENRQLLATSKNYSEIIDKSAVASRDLQHQNAMLRKENFRLQSQVSKLLETIDNQRSEIDTLYANNSEITRMNSMRWRMNLDNKVNEERLKLQQVANATGNSMHQKDWEKFTPAPLEKRQQSLSKLDSQLVNAGAMGLKELERKIESFDNYDVDDEEDN